MRKLISAAWILIAAPAAFVLASGPASASDQTIDAFEAAQQAAWNAHDAAAYAAAFDEHADIITSLGWHWTGQAEAARNVGDGFRVVYAGAHLIVSDVQVRTLTPDLALVTLSWSIDGARTIDTGLPAGQQHGIETQLLQRRGESWRIISQQDTVVAPVPTPLRASTQFPEQAAPPATTFPTTPPPVRRCIVGRANGQCLVYGKPKPAPAR
ncbi:hypothetical protein GCM10009087_33450 [Sphingomonas oligophenolica]|uniref:SgcJ/EcaC family oxidoreductase n=1 Tax=Sphingomonas oligophenolica TaxID=301154 RepID=A0ABU9XYN2_9SPHN